MNYRVIYIIIFSFYFISSCQTNLEFENSNWADGSLKQLVEIDENRTYDKKKLINTTYTIKYYKEGERDSVNYYKIEEYYNNGQISKIEFYKNRTMHGKIEGWYENGQKSLEANYINGKKHGNYISWFPNGVILEQYNYDMDSVIKK